MNRPQLLPGVSDERFLPSVVADSRAAVRRARIRAALIDAVQLVLLAAVDYLFIRFPGSQIPFAGRHHSLLIVATANALMITYLCMARILPRWRARRVATTWCPSERTRFHGH